MNFLTNQANLSSQQSSQALAAQQRYKLSKPIGAVLRAKEKFVSIPAGEVLTVRYCVDANRLAEAVWCGQEVLLFAQDIMDCGDLAFCQ